MHAPVAIFCAPRPRKPPSASSRRPPARACDSSPRQRSSPLPCLNLLAATASARMPRQNHNLLRPAHPQPHFLPAFSLLLALPVAIRRCCAPPCTQHRGSHSSKAPQPEVRGDHPRCSHTQCRHAPQAWGAKTPSHFMWLLCPLPNPASHQRLHPLPQICCTARVSASSQQRGHRSASPVQPHAQDQSSSRPCLSPAPAVRAPLRLSTHAHTLARAGARRRDLTQTAPHPPPASLSRLRWCRRGAQLGLGGSGGARLLMHGLH